MMGFAIICLLSLSTGSAGAVDTHQASFTPGIWQNGTPGDCGGSGVVIKKVGSSKLTVEVDVTTDCFGGGRSNGLTYRGDASLATKDSPSASFVLGESNNVAAKKEGSDCTATLTCEGSNLKLAFKNCVYVGDGGAPETVEVKPLRNFSARPSFRCGKQLSVIEQTLCSNKNLAGKDVKLSALFGKLKKTDNNAKKLAAVKDQRQWLESRQGCLEPSADLERCLANLYDERLKALSEAAP